MDLAWYQYLVIVIAGVLTGIINTLAGSGSLITLPIFIFLCGLPPSVANGTNRIGALIQSGVGIYAFKKANRVPEKGIVWILIPIIIGAIVGSRIAVNLDERMMNIAIGGLMVFMLLVLLINPKRWIRETQLDAVNHRRPVSLITFFLIGVYGGFIQAGVGIFLLAGLVLAANYSLSDSNVIKLVAVFCFSIPALIIFFYYDQVHVGFGLLMAVCQSVGAVLAIRFVSKVPNANKWIYRLLIVIVIVSAAKFLGFYDWIISQF